MKLFRLIQMCLNETSSKVSISNHLSDTFPIQNFETNRLMPLLFNFPLNMSLGQSKKTRHAVTILQDDKYHKEKHRSSNSC
jgi:hypothetical protein